MSFFAPVFNRGKVSPEIEEAVGRAMLTISGNCRVVVSNPRDAEIRKHIDRRRKRVRELHAKGMIIPDIAEKVGRSWGTVQKDLADMGLRAHRTPHPVDPEVTARCEMVKGLRLNGLTGKDIMELLGISQTQLNYAVSKIKKQEGKKE